MDDMENFENYPWGVDAHEEILMKLSMQRKPHVYMVWGVIEQGDLLGRMRVIASSFCPGIPGCAWT